MMREEAHIRPFGPLALAFIIYCLLVGMSDAKQFGPLAETHIQASLRDYCGNSQVINDDRAEVFAQEHVQPNHIDDDLLLERLISHRLVGLRASGLQHHAPPFNGSWPSGRYATGPPEAAVRNAA